MSLMMDLFIRPFDQNRMKHAHTLTEAETARYP